MIFRIGLENKVEGRSLAWVLDHPGCFAYGADGESALAAAPAAILDYARWVASHGEETWEDSTSIELHLEETWEVFAINEEFELAQDGYEVNAWFRHDWKPLTAEEIKRGIQLLHWTRADLLESVQGMTAEDLEQSFPRERWNYAGILRHVGGAEWWYLDRLGLASPREQVPQDPFQRLELVRVEFLETLTTLAGSRLVAGSDGEFWSPRKMLRRAVWHERDHTGHILKLRRGESTARNASP
jgi:hypothetical protein